ncbi:HK97-gp10 family putative phage morphogenesis protein [uncultured Dubosiella sp.]|uniref:HK97-gp10 family putative phage morphogenesis protein n=1 Tax=uncultured Dubosiella sp. TaxID=1937011 RepID=UPI002731FAE2|nr:HK97-gp10 family putative phage morphogenesis protein [uncultured Dubosiella sp.]
MKIICDISGLDKMQRKLIKAADPAKITRAVKDGGSRLQRSMVEHAQFKGHMEPFRMSKKGGKLHPIPVGELHFVKPTGATRRSIDLTIQDGGMTVSVYPQTEYASYLEFGTRFMQAQPFVQPAFDETKDQFIKDLKDAVMGDL